MREKEEYLIKRERIILERGVRQNNVHNKNDTNEYHRFELILTKRTTFVEGRCNFLHRTGVQKARQHMNLWMISDHRILQG